MATADPGVLPTRALAGETTAGLVVDVPGDAARSDGLAAEVVPQRVPKRVAPVMKTKPTRRLQPGDLVCGQCGEGNPPMRKFCSRCGEELTSANAVRTPWYRKVFRRKPKTLAAGARPGTPGTKSPAGQRAKGRARQVMKVLSLVSMGFTAVVIFVPQVREPVDDALGNPIAKVKDWVSDVRDPYDRVFPVTWKSNRTPAAGHPPQAAFDDNRLTYWATTWRPKRRQRDTFLTITFSEPVEDLAVFVYAGAPEDEFTKYHSPSQIRFDYGDGRPNDTMTLVRQQDVQKLFELEHAEGSTTITIWIEQVHTQQNVTQVAISELEFRQK